MKKNLGIEFLGLLTRAREKPGASMRTRGKNLKIQSPRGLGGYPKFFSTPNLIYFVTINSVQNFKTVAQLLLGEKFVWVVGGGGGGGC